MSGRPKGRPNVNTALMPAVRSAPPDFPFYAPVSTPHPVRLSQMEPDRAEHECPQVAVKAPTATYEACMFASG